ncbi:hypothetical protein HELRODRAFT_177956 [Helobdella robusta]|uniref:Endonuclease/exonuclease/phosphatase domain-containing protein n=1 Tax=Helobdella robusta TaxID=6412 RepID=T1FCI5_HELRO|nr:hypothetical protein HELRODRAFT_177956 [Helobdella robusta]ESN97524.1 hypothetical protein HELRODRAFT_177956 [Helobdella robusta]
MYNVKARHDLNDSLTTTLEIFAIEIANEAQSKNIVVVVAYRPPSCSVGTFCESIDDVLTRLNEKNKHIVVTGDFNINLTDDINSNNNQLQQIMDLHGLCKLINLPTRITANKQSVIDNIFVDGSLNVCLQGVLACDLSDHLPVLTQISFSKQVKKEKLIVVPSTKFLFSSNRISNLNKRLCEIDWTDVYDCWDVEMAWVKFVELFKCCMIKCCQVSNNKINKISKQKPWFNSENKKILKAKNRLFKKFLKNPNDENNNNYKSANKIYKKIKNNAKKQYFHNILENNKHDMKKSWKIMNDVLRRSNNDSKSNNIHLKRNGQIVNDPENALNDHFVSIAEKLNVNFVKTFEYKKSMKNSIQNSMFISSVTTSEINYQDPWAPSTESNSFYQDAL